MGAALVLLWCLLSETSLCLFCFSPIPRFSPYFVPLWHKLVAYFEDSRVALLHGDFRPGNMLFLPRTCPCGDVCQKQTTPCGGWVEPDSWDGSAIVSGRAEDKKSPPPVVFADWEVRSDCTV